MDVKWQAVAQGMGHTATVMPQTTLDNTTFFPTTDILIISCGTGALPPNRVATIQQFIQQGGDVFIQSEYQCSVYETNIAFESIVTTLGGSFSWNGTVAGVLAPMNILGSISHNTNNIPVLSCYWYGCRGTTTCGGHVEPFLEYNGDYFGFVFCPPNPAYGRLITDSDQDWILNQVCTSVVDVQLMQNIITALADPNFVCASTGGPTVTLAPSGGCIGNGSITANVSGTAGPYTYSWAPSGGTTSAATGLSAGTYTLTVTDAGGCSTTQMATIAPASVITNTVTSSASCGQNSGAVSVAPSGGTAPYSYLWNPSGATTAAVTGLAAGSYSITITDANGCTGTATITIQAVSSPTASIASNTTICMGQSVTLSASGGGNYLWNTNATTSSVFVSPSATTNYSVVVSIGNCSDTASASVVVNPKPVANAASNITILQGQSTNLSATGGGTYVWSNGAIDSNITVFPTATTKYCVVVTNSNNCTDSACVTVAVELKDCVNKGALYFPNAFSPNTDSENDLLQIYYGDLSCIKSLVIKIYDRWGENVFQSTDPAFMWDGTYRNKSLNSQVFTYYLDVIFVSEEEIAKKGTINLIR